jgi:putative nicotinate phosphoribosyltransferase
MEANLGNPVFSGLATDLYQLTMAAAYHANGRNERASFELFTRKLPQGRSYLVVGGLEQALDYLRGLSFSADEIEYLRGLPSFSHVSPEFFNYLGGFRFTGDVWAMPEGTVAFANEPLLRVTAPLIEAQIVETYLLSTINFQTRRVPRLLQSLPRKLYPVARHIRHDQCGAPGGRIRAETARRAIGQRRPA